MSGPTPIAIAGYSGSGKTSLLERLVPLLEAGGLRVGYLKADAHQIDRDPDGKDTARLRRAGVRRLGIHGRDGAMHFLPSHAMTSAERSPDGHLIPEPSLEARDHTIRARLWNLRSLYHDTDVLLIEGWKHGSLPKIVVQRHDNPRGVIDLSTLRNVALVLDWATLPASDSEWARAAESAADAIRAILDAKARLAARDIVGAVLAGGGSSRMGTDKAALALPWDGEGTWLERALLLLAERTADVMVVGRWLGSAPQPVLPLLEWPVPSHLDLRPGRGPLGGIETALRLAGGRAVLVVPCDLPLLPGRALDLLLEARELKHDAVAFRHADGRKEPAVVVLEPGLLVRVSGALDRGELRLEAFLESAGTHWIPLPEALAPGFTNANTPADRARLSGDSEL